jgi:hypothetical protein
MIASICTKLPFVISFVQFLMPGICDNVPVGPFSCDYSSYRQIPPWGCELRHGQNYLGLSLGMKSPDAARALCISSQDAVWTARIGPRDPRLGGKLEKFSPLKRGLHCDDVQTLAASGYWMFRSKGAPCEGNRYVTVASLQDRVKRVSVLCDRLAAP